MSHLFLENPLQFKMIIKEPIFLDPDMIMQLDNYFWIGFKIQFGFLIKKIMIKEMLDGDV